MTRRTTVERLLMTATMLEDLPAWRAELDMPDGVSAPRRFDMEYWTYGTGACAVGHAMFHPWFNRRGLTAINDHIFVVGFSPKCRAQLGIDAVSAFYGIPVFACLALFDITNSSTHCAKPWPGASTPKQVAKRIRVYVEEFLDNDLKGPEKCF